MGGLYGTISVEGVSKNRGGGRNEKLKHSEPRKSRLTHIRRKKHPEERDREKDIERETKDYHDMLSKCTEKTSCMRNLPGVKQPVKKCRMTF